ncbi:hypothetical protein GUJ93_ZPchr0012g19909 [Zizania palustris]|uniref:Uncharacterized protein n=1 Tax=Zizania palustris TaxID=103762 RepID=A0A8J6BT02_ZIZPA|nr:hypothetical protein GUJ93_ZPchr0012g19909 [Zizania palustris]
MPPRWSEHPPPLSDLERHSRCRIWRAAAAAGSGEALQPLDLGRCRHQIWGSATAGSGALPWPDLGRRRHQIWSIVAEKMSSSSSDDGRHGTMVEVIFPDGAGGTSGSSPAAGTASTTPTKADDEQDKISKQADDYERSFGDVDQDIDNLYV